jgi:hypothetical protein
MTKRSMACDLDDVVVWADGTWATWSEVRSGEYDFMSDDYEVVDALNYDRMRELGIEIDEELD